ncbi:MAG: phosphoribosylformylglycinamidine synthase I [Bdellovibrionota bacterium]|nr:MAG: phosphoribosylformylglycinamidine synthase I [Bdellovibrionota bacterium]
MKVSVVVFPGTNCEHDVVHLYQNLLHCQVSVVWHRQADIGSPDLVIVPGGFSYGDYLRTGALAKISPAMKSIAAFAKQGGAVLGICNGFQILCEAGMLPGVLLVNASQRFLSRFVHIRVESTSSFFTKGLAKGEIITCPIAHFEGNYFVEEDELKRLEDNDQVVFRYCSPTGEVDPFNREWNPNGSLHAIAGIRSKEGNIVGLMPHPERAAEKLVGFIGAATGLRPFAATASAP